MEIEVVVHPPTEVKKSNSVTSTKSIVNGVHGIFATSIFDLPHEMLLMIFCKLEANDVLKVRLICEEWKNLADSEQVWKSLFLSRMKSLKNIQEAPLLNTRESSGSSTSFLRNEDSESDADEDDKSPFESWKSYYHRKMRELYPSRFKERPQATPIRNKSRAKPQNTSFLLYTIGHMFLLLFTISTVFKVAGIFKGTFWSYSVFLSLAVVLFGNACDYKFLWVPQVRLPWFKKIKIACFLCWIAFAVVIVMFAFSCDGLFSWGVSITAAQLTSFACFCLFITERMTRIPRRTNQQSIIFAILVFGMFLASLAVLSALRAKLAGPESERDETSWLTVGLPVFVFSLVATFIGTRTLLGYFKEGTNKEWVEPYSVMMVGALLLSVFFLLMDMAESGDVDLTAVSTPVFVAHFLYFLYYRHKSRVSLSFKWDSFWAVLKITATW